MNYDAAQQHGDSDSTASADGSLIRSGNLLAVAIVGLALALRLLWLDVKPAHFDEGVNGFFVDEITRNGFYHYDPTNFHGPLHFYLLFAAQTLFGRHAWALRLPIALISTGCVGLVFLFRDCFGRRACQIAALTMALSPAMVFYGRYAIHETALLFFLMLTVWGLAGLWRQAKTLHLWVTVLGLTGMVLTKETYLIHSLALALALPTLLLLEHFLPSASLPPARRQWTLRDLATSISLSLAALVFFYSGGLLDWSSLPGIWQTYTHWFSTGTGGASGHEKPWYYWLELLGNYEWPAVAGMLASVLVLRPYTSRLTRYLVIYGLGAVTAYSLIPYKTPWCIIVLIWPFHLIFGVAVDQLSAALDRRIGWLLAGVTIAHSTLIGCVLNFREFTNEDEPYVYVQTLPDIDKLLIPLRRLTELDNTNFHLHGYLIGPEHYPLQWLLGDFTQVTMLGTTGIPENLNDAEFLLVDSTVTEQVESKLLGPYFKEPLKLRGNATMSSVLFLRGPTFARCFSARTPELPARAAAVPATTEPTDSAEAQPAPAPEPAQ